MCRRCKDRLYFHDGKCVEGDGVPRAAHPGGRGQDGKALHAAVHLPVAQGAGRAAKGEAVHMRRRQLPHVRARSRGTNHASAVRLGGCGCLHARCGRFAHRPSAHRAAPRGDHSCRWTEAGSVCSVCKKKMYLHEGASCTRRLLTRTTTSSWAGGRGSDAAATRRCRYFARVVGSPVEHLQLACAPGPLVRWCSVTAVLRRSSPFAFQEPPGPPRRVRGTAHHCHDALLRHVTGTGGGEHNCRAPARAGRRMETTHDTPKLHKANMSRMPRSVVLAGPWPESPRRARRWCGRSLPDALNHSSQPALATAARSSGVQTGAHQGRQALGKGPCWEARDWGDVGDGPPTSGDDATGEAGVVRGLSHRDGWAGRGARLTGRVLPPTTDPTAGSGRRCKSPANPDETN